MASRKADGRSSDSQPYFSLIVVMQIGAFYCQYLLADNNLQLQILVAESGQQKLELCQQFSLDLVLVEFRLPDFDGLEFICRWHSSNKTVPVVMLTRYGSEYVAVRAIKSGAVAIPIAKKD